MRNPRWRLASTLMLALAACTDSVEPVPSKATTLERVTSGNLTGIVGAEISPSPVVLIKDQNGVPLAGLVVTFEATGGGTVHDLSILTNAEGLASANRWTLGTKAGEQTLVVRSAGLAAVTFTAAVSPGPASRITPVAGNNQFGLAGLALAKPLSVKLTDSFLNPIAGAPVSFEIVAGDGTIAGETTTTSAAGIATSGAWTLGSRGPQQVRVRSQGTEVVFDALSCASIAWGCDSPNDAQSDIVFVHAGQLFRSAVDNPKPVQITSGSNDYSPAWSPEGSRVAFARYAQGGSNIYIFTATGELTARTIDGQYHHADPTWSPNGRQLAVTRWSSDQSGIYVMSADADGKPPLLLTAGQDPTWSPDGAHLAYANSGSIHRVNVDGTGHTPLIWGSGNQWFSEPAWSPDGRSIAVRVEFNCDWDDDCDTALGVLEPGATDVRLIVRGLKQRSYVRGPTWSPDGSTIAFTSTSCEARCTTAVSAIKLDGSNERVIIANGEDPSWRR